MHSLVKIQNNIHIETKRRENQPFDLFIWSFASLCHAFDSKHFINSFIPSSNYIHIDSKFRVLV